ncbi:extracellular solute-binding protein [Polynucleobacter sp. MWH-UH2A]|uniref:substrate-binding domain-containing protein n=1 Tax=Polynucleobacter sp. MWH-UH2A TaxID=1855617 RepID=UPI001BFD70B7|nr:substrate-binding domain-containing protein [Polynucleobacter sp. MWH-UH2A]QWD64566.1 substrate-binding domain-containing protein [Polynucleobacter sp. MWH-UH2A]
MKHLFTFFLALLLSTPVMAQLEVIISGGFQGPYKQMLPEFEKTTGIKVVTKSGAPQGSGPKTIKAQLAAGVTADIVILSREGLTELVEQKRILPGSDVDLAQAPLGLAIPSGNLRPDISTVKSFTNTLIQAKKIVVPGSTSGIYLVQDVFPRLGIVNKISVQVTERGSEATAMLAAKNANVAVQPSSELVNIPGVDYVGPIPESLQLIQTFTAAIVAGSRHESEAKKLIDYLSSKNAAEPIKNSGMNLVR